MTDAVTKDTVWAKLTEIFREMIGDPAITLKRETTAKDVEGWDSLINVQLMVAIEGAFGMRFTTGEVTGLANVGELADVVAREIEAVS
jgi:acyl carrier protein